MASVNSEGPNSAQDCTVRIPWKVEDSDIGMCKHTKNTQTQHHYSSNQKYPKLIFVDSCYHSAQAVRTKLHKYVCPWVRSGFLWAESFSPQTYGSCGEFTPQATVGLIQIGTTAPGKEGFQSSFLHHFPHIEIIGGAVFEPLWVC